MGIITFTIAASAVALVTGITSKQTKGLIEYLSSKGATSESKAVSLPKDIARKYILAVPLFSSLKIKKTKDKKYWVS